MLNAAQIGQLAQQILSSLPDSTRDVQKHLHAALINNFQKLDLVTREEFEVQARLLERSREKLAELEKQISELEKHIISK